MDKRVLKENDAFDNVAKIHLLKNETCKVA